MHRMWEFREAQSLCSQGWPLMLDPLMALCLLLDCLMLTINVTVLHLWNVITCTWSGSFMQGGVQGIYKGRKVRFQAYRVGI